MSTRDDVERAVYKHIADVFMRDEVTPDLRFNEDLVAKSSQYFPLIAALEDELGVSIDYHSLRNEPTVGDAVNLIAGLNC